MELKDWFAKIEASVEQARRAGAEVGGCKLKDGSCVDLDKQTCEEMGGCLVPGGCPKPVDR